MKIRINQIFLTLVSICLTGMGVNLIVAANIGSDPLTILQQGISRSQSWPLWLAVMFVNIGLLIFAYITNRQDFGWATIVDPIAVGWVVSLSNHLVTLFDIGQRAWWFRLIVMVLAQSLFSFAYALLIESGGGAHAMDVLVHKLTTYSQYSYPVVRYCFDGLMIVIGAILGGKIGVGTLISLLIQGYLVVLSRKAISNFRLQ